MAVEVNLKAYNNLSTSPLPHGADGSDVVSASQASRLPFYLTALAAKSFPQWTIWNKLYGTLPWKASQGNVMRGVRSEPTPVEEALVFPKAIYDPRPAKNVFNMIENSEEAVVHLHDFESKTFYFQPSFADFLPLLEANYGDIVRQIGIYNDSFTRTQLWGRTPYVYIAGKAAAGGGLKDASVTNYEDMEDATTDTPVLTSAMGKNATKFLNQVVADVDSAGVIGLTLAALDDATAILRDDIMAPFFEGAVNVPKQNDVIGGKYVLVCSSEVWQMLKWDPHFSTFRDCNYDYIGNGFRGSIFGEITTHVERFPLRIWKDGANAAVIPVPQAYQDRTPLPGALNEDGSTYSDLGYPTTRGRTGVTDPYKDAQYEVAWLLGADACKTIRVGPPPTMFSGKMSAKKFYSMSWNGEVELTDQLLVKMAGTDGDAGTDYYDTNVKGRYCKYIAALAMGMVPNNIYSALPIIFKRRRPPVESPAVSSTVQALGSDPQGQPASSDLSE